ncbi:MAG: M20/M25/M40 family metallo-hydrolase, partial [Rhodothermales bacterium]|nr:M20/M25/M40 family metallo-hydrolase [Rhodothermales bacterium]
PMYRALLPALLLGASLSTQVGAQTLQNNDPVIAEMWRIGMEESRTRELAHVLMDRIGPRLPGSEGQEEAQDWLIDTYAEWGIEPRMEEIGTWRRWRAGTVHADMIEPRTTTLEAEIKAWSPGTNGPVRAEVVLPPVKSDAESDAAFVASTEGKFVLINQPIEMCRALQEIEANALEETVEGLTERRRDGFNAFRNRVGAYNASLFDEAGAAGVLESRWSGGWGVNKVFSTSNQSAVALDLSCEDYGLLYRLVESGQRVVIEVNAETEDLGEVPQFNLIGQITGSELPEEYVLLGAHLDSWHAATGATDNGTGTITMLEAMRILKMAYPNPRRTILVGHWANEEVGRVGSRAFRDDNPEIMAGIQAAFNQDNGTWRFEKIEGQGFAQAPAHIPRWMAKLPMEFQTQIALEMPGPQANAGSDHTSFVCAGVPSFRLQSPYDEYRQYTWHTNRDTYDKISFDDLARNATVAAMMAYEASEDPVRFGREQALLPASANGRPRSWPGCRPAPRESGR